MMTVKELMAVLVTKNQEAEVRFTRESGGWSVPIAICTFETETDTSSFVFICEGRSW